MEIESKRMKWSELDTKFLMNNYKKLTAEELSIKLNRTKTSIYSKLWDYKLTPRNKYNRFTEKEELFIKNNYNKISVVNIAKILDRPREIIQSKLQALKLKGIKTILTWDKEKINILEKNRYKDYAEIAKIIGCSRRMVQSKMLQYGFNKFRNKPNALKIICIICKNEFDVNKDNFYFSSKTGKVCQNKCIPCAMESTKKSTRSLEGYVKTLLRNINSDQQRKNKNGIISNIDLEFVKNLYLNQHGKCAITGITLEYGLYGGKNMRNLSIDRINSSYGYTKENIQLVCTWANIAKTNLTMSEFKDFIFKSNNHLILRINVNRDKKVA